MSSFICDKCGSNIVEGARGKYITGCVHYPLETIFEPKFAKPGKKERKEPKSKYSRWIKKHYPTRDACTNKCNEAVRSMINHFRELTVQVGLANGIYHCWCRESDGTIIDPSAKQFDMKIKYVLIAERFLKKHEIELSTGAVFLDT